jgi:two-component system C4-dicarboxylate transport sensor histidine kinase DctB
VRQASTVNRPLFFSPPSAPGPLILIRRLAVYAALTVSLLIACALTWNISWHQGIGALNQDASARVLRVSENLKSTLDRYAFLPYLLAEHPYIQDALRATATAEEVARANTFLHQVNQEAHANATYIINTDGIAIASSNWNDPISFVGSKYLFRPYFSEAIKGGVGHFFGIGTSNAEPGYFVSQAVRGRDGTIIGVTVVKLDIEWFARTDSSDPLIVSDDHGVIFLSSEPAWKYHTLQPLSSTVEADIYRSRQYAQQPLTPLNLVVEKVLSDDARIVRIRSGIHPVRYLAARHRMNGSQWQVTTFSSLQGTVSRANYASAITAFSGICLFLLGFYLRMRRARIRDVVRSGTLLRTAYAELNRRVEERTADLSAANTRLQTEVGERTRAEQELLAAHRELLQASKLAALGQMAAGITHELNQPLAALRTFSDNTRILLARGNVDAARDNLEAIASLTDRMGRITNQLKLFIGKARPRDTYTPVYRAIGNARAVLATRLGTARVALWHDPDGHADFPPDGRCPKGQPIDFLAPPETLDAPDSPAVWCDQLRLEQLLINVIGNAADAVREQDNARIDIIVSTSPSTVQVCIVDNGPGIPVDALAHLFEPFFTTKESGEGLGLGLAISAAIASEYGGSLTAANRVAGPADTGALFILTLRRADGAARQQLLAHQ